MTGVVNGTATPRSLNVVGRQLPGMDSAKWVKADAQFQRTSRSLYRSCRSLISCKRTIDSSGAWRIDNLNGAFTHSTFSFLDLRGVHLLAQFGHHVTRQHVPFGHGLGDEQVG